MHNPLFLCVWGGISADMSFASDRYGVEPGLFVLYCFFEKGCRWALHPASVSMSPTQCAAVVFGLNERVEA